jgi:polysaccharide biosynthesis/export protein
MRTRSIGILVAAGMLLGCAAAQNGTADNAKPADKAAKTAQTTEAQAANVAKGTAVNDPDYVLGTEDVIAINVWHEPEMSRAMTVRPDGKISMPLIGELMADGKTPAQLQAELTTKLQTLFKNPDVTVVVQEIRSQKFNVLGEVQRPGMFPLAKPMTILDAVAMAGGFRDFAKPKKMYILRKAKDGTSSRIPVNYNNVIRGTDKNIQLESRDTIVVP